MSLSRTGVFLALASATALSLSLFAVSLVRQDLVDAILAGWMTLIMLGLTLALVGLTGQTEVRDA